MGFHARTAGKSTLIRLTPTHDVRNTAILITKTSSSTVHTNTLENYLQKITRSYLQSKHLKPSNRYRTIHSAVPSNMSAVAMPVNRATVAAQYAPLYINHFTAQFMSSMDFNSLEITAEKCFNFCHMMLCSVHKCT